MEGFVGSTVCRNIAGTVDAFDALVHTASPYAISKRDFNTPLELAVHPMPRNTQSAGDRKLKPLNPRPRSLNSNPNPANP